MKKRDLNKGERVFLMIVGLVPAGFGVFWTFSAISMGAPIPFWLFGAVFTGIVLVQWIKGVKRKFGGDPTGSDGSGSPGKSFLSKDTLEIRRPAGVCPYCGAATREDTAYCENCGKKLPDLRNG